MSRWKRVILVAVLLLACIAGVLAANQADVAGGPGSDGPGWMIIAVGAISLFATGAWKFASAMEKADNEQRRHLNALYKVVNHSGNRLTRIETTLQLPPLPTEGTNGLEE